MNDQFVRSVHQNIEKAIASPTAVRRTHVAGDTLNPSGTDLFEKIFACGTDIIFGCLE